MAYVGNTARLCQAIVDGNLDKVSDWFSLEDVDPNTRDYTGRTPLQLAVQSSTPEVVKCLVDHGARLIARLADGRTALRLASARGNVDMIRILLEKSEANEAEEEEKEELRKKSRKASRSPNAALSCNTQDEDAEMIDANDVEDDEDVEMKSTTSATSASFVKVEQENKQPDDDNLITDANEDDPDIYDINVLAWDVACSPLHLAIAQGHTAVVKKLVQTFGADVLLPVKLLNDYDKSPRAAILTLVLALAQPFDKAKETAVTLLELGASSAQADMNQTTALHYYVADRSQAIQTLFEHEEPAVRRAINHLSVGGSSYGAQVVSPLMTAIELNDPVGVLKLLEAGAKPMIDFVTFMKAVQTQFENYGTYMSSEQSQNRFSESVEQPVLLALRTEQPTIALELLRRGAEPDMLTCNGHKVIHNEFERQYNKGQTLLDVVRGKLEDLRRYKGEEPPTPPSKLFRDDERDYFQGLEEGTYKFWAVRARLDDLKDQYLKHMESYKESLEKEKNRKGLNEKRGAIRALIAGYEEVEAELQENGAKTFKELYPETTISRNNHGTSPWGSSGSNMFKVRFDFKVPDLTAEKREAYVKIFEAAWNGDLSTIKSFTASLWGWGPTKDRTPLRIAVQDSHEGFSPFSLAVLRGHMDTAAGILEIAQLQFQPRASPKTRYNLDNNSDDGSEVEEGDDEDINIHSERVNDTFTIENIGEIPMEAKSIIPPLFFLTWACQIPKLMGRNLSATDLIGFAIESDNKTLLTSLLVLANHYTARNAPEYGNHFFSTQRTYLTTCIRLGRTQLLEELIRRTCCGASLDHLLEPSGAEVREKPRYYQGLTVRGTKRKDWADAGHGVSVHPSTGDRPPVLEAAFNGKLESVEWLLSDSTVRCYNEFAASNAGDKRIRNIAKAEGGFEKVISQFLDTRSKMTRLTKLLERRC